MSAREHAGARAQDGFTLIETLVSMTLMVFVLGVIATVYFTFLGNGSTSDAAIHAENTDRALVDQLSAALRTAAPTTASTSGDQSDVFTRADPTDVVYNSYDWPGQSGTAGTGSGAHVLRYCLDSAAHNLYFDGLYAYSAAAADPGTSCPSTVGGWTHAVIAGPGLGGDGDNSPVVNSATTPLFTYDSGTLSEIRSVSVNVAVTSTANATTSTTTLPSAVTPRSRSNIAPPSTPPTVTCAPDHTGVLTLGAPTDSNGDPLTAVIKDGGITIGTGTSVAFGPSSPGITTTHSFTLTVSNVSGLTTVIADTVSC